MAGNPTPLPDWIAERIANQAQRSLETALILEQERAASLLLVSRASEFWRDFLSAVREQVQAISALNLSGSMVTIAAPVRGPQLHRVLINNRGPLFKQTYATLEFSAPAGDLISVRSDRGESQLLRLMALPGMGEIGAVWDGGPMPLTARQAAEEVVQEMVERV
jgi:hypothetical protein